MKGLEKGLQFAEIMLVEFGQVGLVDNSILLVKTLLLEYLPST
jgi:hypothetical protein